MEFLVRWKRLRRKSERQKSRTQHGTWNPEMTGKYQHGAGRLNT